MPSKLLSWDPFLTADRFLNQLLPAKAPSNNILIIIMHNVETRHLISIIVPNIFENAWRVFLFCIRLCIFLDSLPNNLVSF